MEEFNEGLWVSFWFKSIGNWHTRLKYLHLFSNNSYPSNLTLKNIEWICIAIWNKYIANASDFK